MSMAAGSASTMPHTSLAAGSAGNIMVPNMSLAAGSNADDIVTMAPPAALIGKRCGECSPFDRKHHQWSWTKNRQGARVEFKSDEWHHKFLAHELCQHGLVMSVEPQQNKLKNSKTSDHESDTNYKCWLAEPMPASGGKGKGWPASRGGWGATMGYSRFKDKAGQTHGWVQFGKKCVEERQKRVTIAVFLECFGFEPDSIEYAIVPPQTQWRPKEPASGGIAQSQPATGVMPQVPQGVQESSQPPQPATGGQPTLPLQQPQPAVSIAGQPTHPQPSQQALASQGKSLSGAPTAPAGSSAGQMQPQQQPQPAIGDQAPAGSSGGQPKPPQQQLGSQRLGQPQPQQQPQPATGGQGLGPTAPAGSSAGQPPQPQQQVPATGGKSLGPTAAAAPAGAAQPQGLQQPQPAIGGQGIGHTAPAGISAGPPQPLQQPTAPATAQPLPQQQTHPATAGQGLGYTAPAGSSAGQPPQPQHQLPATGGKGLGPTAAAPPAGSSAAQPQGLQQPQPATGGPDDDDDDDEDVQDPAAEESDWTADQSAAWEADVAAVTRRHAPHEKRAAGRFWARFTSYDRPTPMPAGNEWVGEAVSRWSGIRSTWLLHNGPQLMTNRQLGILFEMMEKWQPANLIRDVPEEECRSLTAYDGSRSLTDTE
jgi:hypothetical protein